ncbi:MAG TPA: hypothetical protein VKB09_05035, partial [Thermomicrobiales bacterium]|nr:hypothetical protein [Thermomicrobiales bacterium]
MKRTLFPSLIVGCVWAIGLAIAAPASSAAQATPTTTGSAGGTDAASCTIDPRAFDAIADLASTPPANSAPPPGGGVPADPETVTAVTETIRMAVACANANDPLRSYALFTDHYLAERFGQEHPDDLGSLYAALSREPTPADEADLLALVEVRDVTMPAE